jgi:hypothetical protein
MYMSNRKEKFVQCQIRNHILRKCQIRNFLCRILGHYSPVLPTTVLSLLATPKNGRMDLPSSNHTQVATLAIAAAIGIGSHQRAADHVTAARGQPSARRPGAMEKRTTKRPWPAGQVLLFLFEQPHGRVQQCPLISSSSKFSFD